MEIENRKTRYITLTITEGCNLNCSYCYENHKSKKMMSFETARAIIDREFNNCKYNEISLDFFGGEPFLYFDIIKQVDDYLKFKNTDKSIQFLRRLMGH